MSEDELGSFKEASNPILAAGGILRIGDAEAEASLRELAWSMVAVERTAQGDAITRLSPAWLAQHGWALTFLTDWSVEGQMRLCTTLARHGGAELLGTSVDPRFAGPSSPVWRIPNGPLEEAVPFNNFHVSHSGSLTLIFPPDGGFCIHSDGEGYAVALAGPPALVREVAGTDPAAALAAFLDAARHNEAVNGYPPGSIAEEADHYAPFLLRN